MHFSYTEEQVLLREMAGRFARENAETPASEAWAKMAEMGWLALSVPEDEGGIGAGPVEVAILMQELGRVGLGEPYATTAVLGARLVEHSEPATKSRLFESLASGAMIFAAALADRWERPGSPRVVARDTGNGYRLDGKCALVADAPSSGTAFVEATLAGSSEQALFMVAPDTPGLSMRPFDMLDGRRGADLSLEEVSVGAADRVGILMQGRGWLDECVHHYHAALMAEAVGAMQEAFDRTVGYLKTRRQFGRYLSEFQALQHRVADMYSALEEARSMALLAAATLRGTGSYPLARVMPAAWVKISDAAMYVAEQAIQLHGGIGITNELGLGRILRRTIAIGTIAGSREAHLTKLMEKAAD